MSLEKTIVESVECIPEWPLRDSGKSASFFDSLSSNKMVLEKNSKRLFVDSEQMDLEACTMSLRG